MFRVLTFLITVPLSLFVLLFAVSNTQEMTVSLLILDQSMSLPVYVAVLGLMALGFLAGGVLVWLNLYGYRIKYWRLSRQQPKLEAEIERLKGALEEKEAMLNKIPRPYAPLPATDKADHHHHRLHYYDD